MPAPRRRNPLKTLLLAMIAVAVVALAALVITGMTTSPSELAYQNDSYKVPPPDKNPPPLPVPDTYEQAQQIITSSPFYAQTAPAPVRCSTEPINVASATDTQAQVALRRDDGVPDPGLGTADHRGRTADRPAQRDDLRRQDDH